MGDQYAQYLLPDSVELARLARVLTPLTVQPDSRRSGPRVFYDTFDGRLRLAGITLVHEDGALALREGAREWVRVQWPSAPERLRGSDLPDRRLRELLAPVIELRALMPIARVDSRRRTLRVLDGQQKTVVRLVVEEARVAAGADGSLRRRLHVLGVRGYQKALGKVCRSIEAGLGTVATEESLVDEAVARSGRIPGGVSSKPDTEIGYGERAGAAAARISRRLLEVIEANLPGALADTDPEFLHDLRVAVRRTRSLQRELRGVFPAEPLAHFRREFRWLQEITGPSRDLDVYVLELDDFRRAVARGDRDLEPLRELLIRRRARERRRMVEALQSARARKALGDWREFLLVLERGAAGDRQAAHPIGGLAAARIAKVYLKMVRTGGAIDDSSPAEALHELRKTGKELRYLLEFFQGIFPASRVKPMVRALKALQDTLGRFQDRQVQGELIRSLREEVKTLPGGADALMAMGRLIARLEEEQRQAREDFEGRFAAFASPRQQQLVRETFA